ncbi:MAG: hypothetical protein CVT48_00725 [Thermoplasmata archaeon HGW-Thermoplasmata-1]|nr:MAG: hypothetical protein CVT48_00725 [Thermoplasmata archaeon HGW-Thermoplasmata-1]
MKAKIIVAIMATTFIAAAFAGCIGGEEAVETGDVDAAAWTSVRKAPAGDHVLVPNDPFAIVAAVPFAMGGDAKLSILFSELSKPGVLSTPIPLGPDANGVATEAALACWESSTGAVMVSTYEEALVAAPFATLLDVPMLIEGGDVESTLFALGVTEVLCIGSASEIAGIACAKISLPEVNTLIADLAYDKGKVIDYIALTAADDIEADYPGVAGLSAMAAVLAGFHGGIVIASDEFSLESKASYTSEGMDLGTAAGENFIKPAIRSSVAMLENKGHVPLYLALVGCPTTVAPIFESGYAIDSFYGDLDDDPDVIELAVGRYVTIDLNDGLDLFARTAHYQKFVETHVSSSQLSDVYGEWRDVAGFIYGHGLLETAWPNTLVQTELMMRQDGGFSTMTMAGAHPDAPGVDQAIWEASNMVYLLVHGSPSGYSCTEGALGPTGKDIREWNLGPGLVYASTCLTTRLAGEKLAESFSLNFLHAGGVCYVGANEVSADGIVIIPGVVDATGCDRLGEIFLRHVVIGNKPVGLAFRDAKNEFLTISDDYHTWNEYVLYGDPALNTYEPVNGF